MIYSFKHETIVFMHFNEFYPWVLISCVFDKNKLTVWLLWLCRTTFKFEVTHLVYSPLNLELNLLNLRANGDHWWKPCFPMLASFVSPSYLGWIHASKRQKMLQKLQVENINETTLNNEDDVKSNKSHGFGLRWF